MCVEHTRLRHTPLVLIERGEGGGVILLNDRSRVVKGEIHPLEGWKEGRRRVQKERKGEIVRERK